MPSCPSDIWNSDGEAWAHLEARGFTQVRCHIRPPCVDYAFDHETGEAVDYLVGEWDWAYSDVPQPSSERKAGC